MPRSRPANSTRQKEAKRLVAIRNKMEMTQTEFAKELKVTLRAIGMWERGERTIQGPLLKLMEFYEEKLGMDRK